MKPHIYGTLAAFSGVALATLTFATSALAATPDGMGPWADSVVSASQGMRKDGSAVLASRSNPMAALGVAEGDTVDEHFYSLGFGGSITLGFENGISSGVIVVEATNDGYPVESAHVELSSDGVHFVDAGLIDQDGEVRVPDGVGCAQFVRVTDASNPNNFTDGTADAYDVDGVQAQGLKCSSTGKFTGGGTVKSDDSTFKHGFEVNCNSQMGGNFEMNWGKGNKFHLETLSSALCVDDPAVSEQNPVAGFDTYIGKGMGRYNGVSGYAISFKLVDAGEPGVNDTAMVEIKDPSNNVVFSGSGKLQNGNHQAHN